MSNGSDLPPRIIKKVNKHGGGHGGAWKVAYADFVTAMMALFIVLWVLSQDQNVKQMVANYFKDPIGFSSKAGKNLLGQGTESSIKSNQNSLVSNHLKEIEILKTMGDKILGELAKDPTFKNIVGQIKIEFVKDGLKIELLDSSKNLFFEIGTSKLTKEAQLLLKKIGDQLAKLPNKIIIEGHTDARPYAGGSDGYTNFELSADRANSARRALTADSLSDNQIDQVRGYADRRLRDPADPYSFVNRRISIIVKYKDNTK
jgi:chemotaxis protein MotB